MRVRPQKAIVHLDEGHVSVFTNVLWRREIRLDGFPRGKRLVWSVVYQVVPSIDRDVAMPAWQGIDLLLHAGRLPPEARHVGVHTVAEVRITRQHKK